MPDPPRAASRARTRLGLVRRAAAALSAPSSFADLCPASRGPYTRFTASERPTLTLFHPFPPARRRPRPVHHTPVGPPRSECPPSPARRLRASGHPTRRPTAESTGAARWRLPRCPTAARRPTGARGPRAARVAGARAAPVVPSARRRILSSLGPGGLARTSARALVVRLPTPFLQERARAKRAVG